MGNTWRSILLAVIPMGINEDVSFNLFLDLVSLPTTASFPFEINEVELGLS